ncbi:MAG: polyprenyl synthetase family protein [Chloroflexi bacterium]|nr:polyprenyl synthetase family protein [Chloroflexota bacterium]
MWQERQAELLREEIEALLAALPGTANFHGLLKEPLTKARRGLSADVVQTQPWPLLPLMVCEAVSGRYEHVLPAAASLQFLMAAGDVFDDIEDADSAESLSARYGPALAVNAATALLVLAQKALAQLKGRGVAGGLVVRAMDVVNSFYITACAGQHVDLSLASEMATSEEQYLRIIEMKSASQMECACHIGALLAPAAQDVVDTFGLFGHNLGMAAQITNDVQGIIKGSDILKQKITLPVIYALAQTDGEAHHQMELAFSKQAGPPSDMASVRDLLYHAGAIHYAIIKAELYRQQASDVLCKAEAAGASTEKLKLFLG